MILREGRLAVCTFSSALPPSKLFPGDFHHSLEEAAGYHFTRQEAAEEERKQTNYQRTRQIRCCECMWHLKVSPLAWVALCVYLSAEIQPGITDVCAVVYNRKDIFCNASLLFPNKFAAFCPNSPGLFQIMQKALVLPQSVSNKKRLSGNLAQHKLAAHWCVSPWSPMVHVARNHYIQEVSLLSSYSYFNHCINIHVCAHFKPIRLVFHWSAALGKVQPLRTQS